MGLVLSGLSLAQTPDYYRQHTISGRVLCIGYSKDSIDLPCPPVTVALQDAKGKSLSEVQTRDGFAFRVRKKHAYRLEAVLKGFGLMNPTRDEKYLGDEVVFKLVRK